MIEPPKPPSPPSMLDPPPEAKKYNNFGPIKELGMSPEDFAEVAISCPIEWTGEQLDQIQQMMEGEELEPEIQMELLQETLVPRKSHQPPPQKQTHHVEDEDDDVGDIRPLHQASPYVFPLEVPSSRVNLDDWLKKVKPA